MKVYEGANIRNVCFVGHGSCGKTSLVSGLLFTAGMMNRLGRVDDGTTVTDYDEEEVERKISINTSMAYAEWGKTKVNILDSPGYGFLIHETKGALRVADSAVVVVDGVAGVEVQTEKVWSFADEFQLPRLIVLNKLDRERASFERAMESVRKNFGRSTISLQLPIGIEKNFRGVVDLIHMKAHTYDLSGSGKLTEGDIPAEMKDPAQKAHEGLVEMVAEGNDALMEEFFEKGTLPVEDFEKGLLLAILERRIVPVVCTSAYFNVGAQDLLDVIVNYMPSANAREVVGFESTAWDKEVRRKGIESEPLSLFVFKTVADPFAGRVSYFRVYSGSLKNDASIYSFNRSSSEKMAHIGVLQGKTSTAVPELKAGDLGAIAKLKETLTGDTLGDKGNPIYFRPVAFPEPAIAFAIEPKTRQDEDRIGTAIHRVLEEDLALRFSRDLQTHELLLSGTGQQHIEIVVSRLRRRYQVEVKLKTPKVPYRETITGKADAQGRHKKQTGGHGQYGDCKIKMEPLARGQGFEFANEIFGGSIPRNFIPAVEKGIVESAGRGFLAGYPVVDFKVELYDGSYHDVDSSELAFKIAGSLAFKKAMEQARPVLLEPIMNVEIITPEQYAGDLMGDLNSRRGRIQGMDSRAGNQIIKAQVPMAEMLTYSPVLTSATQGRGTYSMEFSHYDIVPQQISQKIVEAAKAARQGKEEEVEE
ncbi:MAG: elongation factor G [Acidobacteriia bacterium]|nr:elongation factor G [Terriglobia bacterium]